MKKKCNTCNIDKPINDFTITKYKGEIRRRPTCKKCTSLRTKEWTKNNKNKRIKYIKEYSEQNKETINEKSKKYYKDNKQQAIYKSVKYKRERRKYDELFRLSDNIRKSIVHSFKTSGLKKNCKTAKILGCNFTEFKEHIEKQFATWMTWDNYGKYNGEFNFGWDIDHIIPINSAKTEEDIIRLNHYTNFQPLCSKFNRHIKRGRF